jgi:hypothetical protein
MKICEFFIVNALMDTVVWPRGVIRLNGELFVVNSGSLTLVYLSPSILCIASSQFVVMTTSDDCRYVRSDNLAGVEENTIRCQVSRADFNDHQDPYFTYYNKLIMQHCDPNAIQDAFERGFMMRSAHEIAAGLY